MICFLALSQGWREFRWSNPLANIGSLLYIGSAGVLLVMGVIFLVAGFAAAASMTKLKSSLQSPAALREAFDAAGEFSMEES